MRIFKVLYFSVLMLITHSAIAQTPLKQFLDLHNQERESLELPALQWSEELQQSAQSLVNAMAFTNKHKPGNSGHGENSWSGQNNEATFEEIFELWSAGKSYFLTDKPVPLNCSENFEQCAGYSQVVWSRLCGSGFNGKRLHRLSLQPCR